MTKLRVIDEPRKVGNYSGECARCGGDLGKARQITVEKTLGKQDVILCGGINDKCAIEYALTKRTDEV